MLVAAAAAVVASASTLAGLAHTAGWSGWTPWLLPAALDVGGSVGGWCWLHPHAPQPARRFGRSVAVVGAAGTLVGNAAGHLIVTGYLSQGPALVVVVGAVPAAVLVALAHLAALLTTDRTTPTTEAVDGLATSREAATMTGGNGAGAGTDDADAHDASETDTRSLLLATLDRGPATVAELVRATGRSRTTVVGHLDTLAARGIVLRGQDKRYRSGPRRLLLPLPASTHQPTAGPTTVAGTR